MAVQSATFRASPQSTSLADFMSAMPWFETLDALERRRVLSETSVEAVPAGEYLARQGDPPTFWYGVIDGLLKLCWNERYGRSLTFTGVCARSWFGEGTLVKNEPRRYDVVALRNTHVACMPAALFNRLLQTSFAFDHFVIELLNDRCGQFIGRFLSHVMLNGDAQVARALAGLFHPRMYPGMEPRIRISQEEVAHLSGLSRSRCNEALRRLKEAGLVRTEYGGITIVDLHGLEQFAG